MTDELKEVIKTISTLLIGGIVSFFIQHYRRPAEIKDEHEKNASVITQTSTETISKLILQVNGLIERDIAREQRIEVLEKQVDDLERMNKTYINAYNRAFTFISKRVAAEEIPDFMVTQDLKNLMPK